MTSDSLPLLTVARAQVADQLSRPRDDQLDRPTPGCAVGSDPPSPLDRQLAELSVHTWDLGHRRG
jgi:hypothetical protein